VRPVGLRLEFKRDHASVVRIGDHACAGRSVDDGDVAGPSERPLPLLPHIRRLAISFDAVKGEIADRFVDRNGMHRQSRGSRKLRPTRVEELERVGDMCLELDECHRPSRSLARRREIFRIKRDAASSPYRGRPSQHPSAVQVRRRMPLVVDRRRLEEF